MSGYIWSLEQLQERAAHPDAAMQEWAIRKWFLLYPDSARSQLPKFLSDSQPGVVGAALSHLGSGPKPELVPLLRDIYLQGTPELSSRAIGILGDWQIEEAVAWMKQRILDGNPLQVSQVGSMIRALGQIPSEEARDLLKSTESSINDSESQHWGAFYVALLNHRRAEDVDTILDGLADPSREQRRLDAYGVLLSLVDLRLNPTEAYYGSSSVRKHVLRRLDELAGRLPHAQVSALREASGQGWTEASVEERLAALSALGQLLDDWRDLLEGLFHYQLAAKTTTLLKASDVEGDLYHPLLLLAWLALLAAVGAPGKDVEDGNGSWQKTLEHFLRDEPPQPVDMALVAPMLTATDRSSLIGMLRSVLTAEPHSWRAVKAILLLGELKGVEAVPELIRCMGRGQDRYGQEAIYAALCKMGEPAVEALLPLVGSADQLTRQLAWDVLTSLPTREGVQALATHVAGAYQENPERTLDRIRLSGAKDLLPFVEKEYRPGELDLGRCFVFLSWLHGIQSAHLTEVERDVKRLERQAADHPEWPRSIYLELNCTQCRKRYHYEVQEIHLHPPEVSEDRPGDDDFVAFHHGFVLRDDIRCKHCATTNAMELTPTSRDRLAAEFIRILAHARAGKKIPASYPIVLTNWSDDQHQRTSLTQIEREHLKAIEEKPSKPAAHLAMGKFYEYVKQDGKGRKAYLRALDLDARCLEALAGLARIDHAAGHLKEALEWIESCYDQLDTGRFYLVKDQAEFKKACRDARHQYARESGVKPKEAPVAIRYHLETSDHPKNRPCPCGSGKKYKLCCMNRQEKD
jgi:hypothetical protein